MLSFKLFYCRCCLRLQDAGILIGRKQHGTHHKPNFEGSYSIVMLSFNLFCCRCCLRLQDAGILIGRKQHGAHHKPNFEAVLQPVLLPAAVCVCFIL
jgi:hypothetical protein